MALRKSLLDAARRAGEVLSEQKVRDRIAAGYTRINPVEIAENAGVAVMFQHLDKLLGAFLSDERPGIILNVARPPGLVHMTCAHELGHFFLNHDTTTDTEIEYGSSASTPERQADQFAYSLLAPQWLVAHIAREKKWTTAELKNPTIMYQLSLRLGTSFSSTAWTLERYGFIPSGTAAVITAAHSPKEFKQQLLGSKALCDWHPDVWLLDDADRRLVLEPHAADRFVVDLPSHITAGYSWSLDDATSEGFRLEPLLLDATVVAPAVTIDRAMPVGQTNSIRCLVYRPPSGIEPRFGDRGSVSLIETQHWLGTSDSDDRYSFQTEYEMLAAGVSQLEKEHLIAEARDAA